MNGFSITQEALLATEELIQKTTKAQAAPPQVYKKFVQLIEKDAIKDRQEHAGEEEEGSDFSGGAESEVPGEGAGEQTPEAQSAEENPTPDSTTSEETGTSNTDANQENQSAQNPDGGDALTDTIDQAPEPAMESLSEWIKDKTQYSDSGVIRNVGALAAGLAHIGVTYGPAIVNYMFKGMIWTFSRLGTVIYTGSQSLANYIEKSNNSISKLEARLNNAEQTIMSQLNEGRNIPGFTFKNQKAIEYLKVGSSIDFSSNLRVFSSSLVKATDSIAAEFEVGVSIVDKIANSDSKNKVNALRAVMDVSVPRGGFTKGALPGYDNESDKIEQYHTAPLWPGDASLIFNRPLVKNDDISDIADAYGKSDMFVAMSKEGINSVSDVASMNGAQIVIMAKSVRILLASMKEVTKSQERMKSLSPKLALKAKQMFIRLADEKAKVSMQDSMVEPLYLRASLASTVFVAGSTSALTHASRVAAAAVAYVEAHASKIATSTE